MNFEIIYQIIVLSLAFYIVSTEHDLETQPKIINGTEALWNGTRYQVSLRLKERDWLFGGGHICGGTLIADDIVLTAGHCIWNSETKAHRKDDELSVVVGNVNRYSMENVLIFNITKISMLPTFNVTSSTDDIAILFLNGKVPRNYTFAYPIALNMNRYLKGGIKCEVSGWGLKEMGDPSAVLMVVDVNIINRTICSQGYGDLLTDGMICAGYMEGERDSCEGDSGGPLVCNEKLVGLVSFGFRCATPNFPGVYADVAHYINWIRGETGINSASAFIPMSFFLGISFFTIHI